MKIFKKLAVISSLFSGLLIGQLVYAGSGLDPAFKALKGSDAQNYQLDFGFRLIKTMELENYGLVYKRYQFYFGDVPVYGGQLTILEDSKGVVQNVIGNDYSGKISPANFRNLTANDAASVVTAQIGSGGQRKIDVMIDPKTGRYFFHVETRRADSRWFYLIDAENGRVINKYDGLTTGTGIGVLGDTKSLTGLTTGSGPYQMVSSDGRQKTYDAQNKNSLPGILATDNNDTWDTLGRTSPGQPAMVDAQFYARVTDNYYQNIHSFDWVSPSDGNYSQGMVSSAHLKRNYNNAYWNGTQMAYGDGDGISFINFSGDPDVVGHELSHGVTEATSNLIYQGESGALNEAFSDMMGTAVEFYNNTGNWTLGEDITLADYSTCDLPGVNTPGIRSLQNPPAFCDPSYYADRYKGTSDNGGVHTNSSIANHWFYLLVNGGQNADPVRASGTDVAGIELRAAETIAFLGFTTLPASANFCAARAGTMAVAGSSSTNVGDAWDEVGVNDALCTSGGGGEGGTAVTISGFNVQLLSGPKFNMSWITNVPSDSVVVFDCCGTHSFPSLVTNHSITFTGTNGYHYTGYVTSTDANGHASAPYSFDFVNN